MPTLKPISRHLILQRLRRNLERQGYPRLQMMLLVALTGGAGFLASFVLLRAGVDVLWLRYGTAVAIAYLVFLALLWLWLRTRAEDYIDAPGALPNLPDGSSAYQGGGGRYAGGGANSSWDEPALNAESGSLPSMKLDAVSSAADADELAIPLAVVIFVGTVLIAVLAASVSVVYSAPALFAELLLDGLLSATLYRRLRRLETRHWLETAVRRTFVPFISTLLAMMALGWALSVYAPDARSLGDILGR